MIISDILIIVVCFLCLYYLLNGAMYVPTHKDAIAAMIELVRPQSGTKIVDLGSGDGRIVAEFAKRGASVTGIEINPILVWWSQIKISRLGLSNHAKIRMRSFWGVNFGQYDVIIVFGITHIMKKLEDKIRKEAKPGTLIISNVFDYCIQNARIWATGICN